MVAHKQYVISVTVRCIHKHNFGFIPQIMRYALDTMFPELRPGVKVTMIKKKCVTLSDPQNVSIHSILVSFVKNYRRYMYSYEIIIPEMSLEVNVNAILTQKWYVTPRHPKMHPHTTFEIPT